MIRQVEDVDSSTLISMGDSSTLMKSFIDSTDENVYVASHSDIVKVKDGKVLTDELTFSQEIDLSIIPEGKIIPIQGIWENALYARVKAVKVKPNEKYRLIAGVQTYYSFLKTYNPVVNENVDFIDGTGSIILPANTPIDITIPDECNYLLPVTARNPETGGSDFEYRIIRIDSINNTTYENLQRINNLDIINAFKTGINIPFILKSYGGISTGNLYYIEANNRIMIEVPFKYVRTCYIKNPNYHIRNVLIHQNELPITTDYQTIEVFGNEFNIEEAVKSINDFTPNFVKIIISNIDNNSSLNNITNIDDIVGFSTYKELSELKESLVLVDGINIPFELGSYKGLSTNYLQYMDSNTRLRMEFPLKRHILFKADTNRDIYITGCLLFKDSIPTSEYKVISKVGVTEISTDSFDNDDFNDYNKIFIGIGTLNNDDLSSVTSVDDMISIYKVNRTNTLRVIKKVKMMGGTLSNTTGLYPGNATYFLNYAHTPKFIRINGKIVIKTHNLNGFIAYYDENQDFLSTESLNTSEGDFTLTTPYYAEFFRIGVNSNNDCISKEYVEIECDAIGYEELFQKRPTDDGYQNITFIVDVDTCKQPSTEVSDITQQYEKSTDSGVLHLPASYTIDGEPTKLIVMLHGAAERYTTKSTRFGDNNPYKPEWDAAGYAQLDIDLIPDLYNYTGTSSGGSDDDYECLCAAYNWVINHFNIATDGVYLMGRSRGGHAVMHILSRLNLADIPIICAISNAGAHFIVNYILRANPSDAIWQMFCDSHGLPVDNRPTQTSGQLLANSDIVTYLRNNIDIWWNKSIAALPMMIENTSEYQTREQIFDLIVNVFSQNIVGGDAYTEFLEKCKFHSPIPLRFDWCVGDNTQNWLTPNHYSKAMKDAFVNNKINGNSVYREWPTNASGNAHYHEKNNIYVGDYKLQNGNIVTNPSMAAVEWLLWCQKHDKRYNGSVQPGPVSSS